MTPTTAATHIRWMIRRDMPAVLAIEGQCFGNPWTGEEFARVLRERNCIGMVAEQSGVICGYMIYELHKTRVRVLNFAVSPLVWRQGVGTNLVAKLVGKLSEQGRTKITLEVRETNLAAQKFFAAKGFRATSVLRGFYENCDEDAYQFAYSILGDK